MNRRSLASLLVFGLLGKPGGKPIISVRGHQTYPTQGTYD